ncbi:ABC-type transporter, integral membrane subunit [halophilic archaeon DL31]|jgi:peptide/nickel transport system permease protein|nr:ABC-type transporter, integral membrane subunit [halophilic archaeon DL31]
MSHLQYSVKRLLQAIPVLLGITSITFLLINAMPGSPVEVMLGPTATEEMIESARVRYGFDQPLHIRYVKYIIAVLGGDLGRSIHYGVPVTTKILERLPVTLLLLVSSFTFAISVAIPLGIASARRRNQPIDHASRVVSLIGVSTPNFWIGLVLIIVFGYYLQILPSNGLVMPFTPISEVSGADSRLDVLVETLRSLIMPTIALGTLQMAAISRIERSSMLEVLGRDYIKLARAFGVKESVISRKHAFRNAQLPVVTIIGLQLTSALGGAVLTETVFNINGMGRLIIQAIRTQDYALIMGTTLFFGFMFVVGTLLTDLTYAYLDPRVTYDGE